MTSTQTPAAPQGLTHFDDRAADIRCDGRYRGSTGEWWIDLRVDLGTCRAISVDLHTAGDGPREVSGHTNPNTPVASLDGQRWETLWTSTADGVSRGGTGWLALESDPEVAGRLRLELQVDVKPEAAVTISAIVDRQADLLRSLTIAPVMEKGVTAPEFVEERGLPHGLKSSLAVAGFDVQLKDDIDPIDPPEGGLWQGVDVLAQLNSVMERTAPSALAGPAWEARLLFLSKSDRPGLCGVMFDIFDENPRQGAAVFVNEIRDRLAGNDCSCEVDRRILQTAIHEVGHVLNLTHRFSTGGWNSKSFMNYPHFYRGGGQPRRYQRDFDWSFDADELRFLRHGFRPNVIPGGARFGSDPYWLGVDKVGTQPGNLDGLRLWFTSSAEGAAERTVTLARGEPLFLTISLANVGPESVIVPRHVLDHKTGHLSVRIVRLDGGDSTAFEPFMRRCYEAGRVQSPPPWLLRLGPGQSLHDNINLAYGTQGPPLLDIGRYQLTPVLTLLRGDGSGGVVEVKGPPWTVVVENPREGSAELAENPAALIIGLGGTIDPAEEPDLSPEETLELLPSPDDSGRRVQAVCDRVRGLHLRRLGRHQESRRLLRRSIRNANGIFDPQTMELTRRLIRRSEIEEGQHHA